MEGDEAMEQKEKRGDGSSPEKIFFFRKISKQGDILIISIPKPLYPMIEEGGFLRRRLKITLEKVDDFEDD